jgi:hypothetical protein
MMTQPRQLPNLPEIGHPESHYARKVHEAERRGDIHMREAFKVGQYVTLAMDPGLTWEQKLKYFSHALRRHCNPPPVPDEQTWVFYRDLAELVRGHCGSEALRLAVMEDDLYDKRMKLGVSRERLEAEAEIFFARIIPHERCPDYFDEEDWKQLKMIRDQWI